MAVDYGLALGFSTHDLLLALVLEMVRFLPSTDRRGCHTARLSTDDRRWVSPGVLRERCYGDAQGGLRICHRSSRQPETV
jgi:hypothetical protein